MSLPGGIVRVAAGATMVVLVVMGFLKLADLPGFSAAVRAWTLVPRAATPALTIVVPLAEIALGAWWYMSVSGRRWLPDLFCLALIVLFSVVYVLQWRGATVPPCGCFGILARRYRDIETAKGVLTKNAVMVLVLAADAWLRMRRTKAAGPPNTGQPTPVVGVARAFTLIETLAVVMIVGILMALLSPSLSRVRDAGKQATTLSNLRSHAAIFAAYHTDYRDGFPSLTDPRATFSIIRCESAGIAVRAIYFEASMYWNVGLADQYYGGNWSSRSFQSGWDPPGPWLGAGLHWACSFVADPSYYDQATRIPPPAQLRPIRASEVVFPSAKGLMTAYAPWVRFRRIVVSTVDGRAAEFKREDWLGDVPSGDGAFPAYTTHWPAFTPMTHTQKGVRGRDVQ